MQRNRRIYSYSRCRVHKPFNAELLTQVQKLTRNFMINPNDEPLLHIFLCFLTFYKRPRQDPVFLDWIKTHYTSTLSSALYTAMEADTTHRSGCPRSLRRWPWQSPIGVHICRKQPSRGDAVPRSRSRCGISFRPCTRCHGTSWRCSTS